MILRCEDLSFHWAAQNKIYLFNKASIPPLSNTFISLITDTSLAAVITVPEMFLAAQRIVSVTYEPLILYVEAALIYVLFSTVLSKLQTRLETYYQHHIPHRFCFHASSWGRWLFSAQFLHPKVGTFHSNSASFAAKCHLSAP